jgi:hypothetical protein
MKAIDKTPSIKKAYKFSVIAICIFYALYFVSVPIQLSMSVDYQFKNTLAPQLVKFIGKVLEVCGIAVIYAITSYSVYRFSTRAYAKAFRLCAASAFIKCGFAQTVYWIMSGGIPAVNNGFLEEFIWLILLPTVLEIIQFTIFLLIARRAIIRYNGAYDIAYGAANAKGIAYREKDSAVYPFVKLTDFKNPLLKACLTGGMVITVSKVLLSILEEIDMAINGLPIKTLGDALGSVARFASDIACGVLAFTVMVFTLIKAFELWGKNKKQLAGNLPEGETL